MDAEVGAWFGMLGPAGMSPQAIAWVNREATKVFSAQDTRDRFVQQGAAVPLGTPEAFGKFIEAESESLWRHHPARRDQARMMRTRAWIYKSGGPLLGKAEVLCSS